MECLIAKGICLGCLGVEFKGLVILPQPLVGCPYRTEGFRVGLFKLHRHSVRRQGLRIHEHVHIGVAHVEVCSSELRIDDCGIVVSLKGVTVAFQLIIDDSDIVPGLC